MKNCIDQHVEDLGRLCVRHQVRRLDLFGSAATGLLADDSDLDFLVEFKPEAYSAYADSYFGFLEALQELFDRPIDLVVDSAITNPYFRQAVQNTKIALYEA